MTDKIKSPSNSNFLPLLAAVAFAYFSFGAITNVAGAIIPKIRESYEVSSTLSTILAAVFFIAYGVTSIPWGNFMQAQGKKSTLIWGSIITTLGVCLFAAVSGFYMNMLAMFLCGLGITGLQVALNPLVAEVSDPAKYSRNLTIFMVINGVGSYLAPQVVTFVKELGHHWSMTYWIFTALSLIMLAAIALPKYPQKTELKQNSASANHTLDLLKNEPMIYFYALGIFLYVGVEVGVANTIGFYLEDKLQISELLASTAEATKNTVISNYWGGLLLGRLLGSFILDRIKTKTAIKVYISLAALSLYVAMNSDLSIAVWAFPAIGFFISIMFPSIYSLATNSFDRKYTDSVSAVLCTAIIGGAFIAPLMAKLAEISQADATVPNWDIGLLLAFVCYLYIFSIGLFAKESIKS